MHEMSPGRLEGAKKRAPGVRRYCGEPFGYLNKAVLPVMSVRLALPNVFVSNTGFLCTAT
jgi:hypothetical protein